MPNALDLTNCRFGKLKALKPASKTASGAVRWLCECGCGKEKEVIGSSLIKGATTSCGCNSVVSRSATHSKLYKHGGYQSLTYRSWAAMWQRTTNPNNIDYSLYKDKVPPEIWRDFKIFVIELGERPSKFHSLERIDNEKGYGPGNCKWATKPQQARNSRQNVIIEYEGEKMCILDFAKRVGISHSTIYSQLYRGWTMDRIISNVRKQNV